MSFLRLQWGEPMHNLCNLVRHIEGFVETPCYVSAVGIAVPHIERLNICSIVHDALSRRLVECRLVRAMCRDTWGFKSFLRACLPVCRLKKKGAMASCVTMTGQSFLREAKANALEFVQSHYTSHYFTSHNTQCAIICLKIYSIPTIELFCRPTPENATLSHSVLSLPRFFRSIHISFQSIPSGYRTALPVYAANTEPLFLKLMTLGVYFVLLNHFPSPHSRLSI
ncbi:hypothetical protein L873DRAFT_318392 [Choiromyces venosus 120613-1]|uniref:Uncharacterized protein n=1 Tax=Choiromyces venosus 120613-1 TaxID=1336337 RepID=A0A3N4IZM1_9PEZI|nr:hypothetical protein L873DRAFT_318392 [Choiromyces venosus 120613-1]